MGCQGPGLGLGWHCCGHGRCWELAVPCHPGPPPAVPPLAPADTDTGVEPLGKVLLSKPPLATAPRRRDQASRGAAKGSGHAPQRTRGQVLFPWAVSPAPAPPALPRLPSCCQAPSCVLPLIRALREQPGHRALLQPRAQLSAPSAPSERGHGSSRCPLAWGSPTAALRAAPTGGGSHLPPRSPPSPALSTPCLSRQLRATAAPEIFEGSAVEEEFLQIQVVEGSWSPESVRDSLGWTPGQGALEERDGMETVGNGDDAQGSRTQPLLSSTQTTAKGLPRRVPSAPEKDPALQVSAGHGAAVSDPSVGAPVPRLMALSLSRCTTSPAVSAPCAPALPALPAPRWGSPPWGRAGGCGDPQGHAVRKSDDLLSVQNAFCSGFGLCGWGSDSGGPRVGVSRCPWWAPVEKSARRWNQALNFSDRERKVTEGSLEREASPDS